MMFFKILLYLRKIFRDIVSIFLGTLSRDIILIFRLRKRCFAKDFALAVCNKDSLEEFAFFSNSYTFLI